MKLIPKLTLLALTVALFSTCEKFEVKPLTKVETGTATPQATAITVSAKIIDLSGQGNTDHGFCYATHNEPTANDSKLNMGNPKVGEFSGTISGLNPNKQYYVRAFCHSAEGIVYGKAVAITTLDGQSAQTTTSVTSITATSAISGGNITSDGGDAVTARGVVWSTSQDPSVETNQGITSNGKGTGSFTSSLTNLQPQTLYYVRAYATNSVGTTYGNQLSFTTLDGLPVLTTTAATSITATTAAYGGNITSDGGFAVTARGVVWSTSPDPTVETNQGITSNGTGTGSFTSNLTNLQLQTLYYVRAYATNSMGTSYGNQVNFTSGSLPVDVTNPTTGKTWMDRNLGATRAATSSTDSEAYGDLYQWGRGADGHEKRNSPTTSTKSSSDNPGHGNFILAPSSPYDWRSPQNNNLWQGVSGTNNPCPTGYRLPTDAEWEAERLSWSSNNSAGAFASPLKLPVAGHRVYRSGSLLDVGSGGYYWSSTVDGAYSRFLYFTSSGANMLSANRAGGLSVRCLKE